MTTLRQLVKKALRESNIIQLGSDPEADEFAEAVDHLKTLIASVLGDEVGEFLTDYNFGVGAFGNPYDYDDYSDSIRSTYIPPNSRLIFNQTEQESLKLNPNPRDGERFSVVGDFEAFPITILANGRKIEGTASITLSTNTLNREWMYRADLGTWMRVTALGNEDDCPFPSEFDDFFIIMLALRVSPQYGSNISDASAEILRRARKKLKAKYQQKKEMPSELGLRALFANRLYRTFSNFSIGRP